MQDKTIYNYFKTRRHQFEEIPGDELWARIESALDMPSPSGKGFSLKTLMFLTTALITIGIVAVTALNNSYDSEKTVSPVRQDKSRNTEAEPVVATETVKPQEDEAAESLPITIQSEITIATTDTVKPKKPYVAFQKINGITTAMSKDSIPFDINNIETAVSSANGRITVNTKEKLTPLQFEQLIEKVLAENEQAVGTLITIKAPGHKVFRQIIKAKNNTYPAGQHPNALTTELTIKNTKPSSVYESIIVRGDSLKPNRDSLAIEPEYIHFKVAPAKE